MLIGTETRRLVRSRHSVCTENHSVPFLAGFGLAWSLFRIKAWIDGISPELLTFTYVGNWFWHFQKGTSHFKSSTPQHLNYSVFLFQRCHNELSILLGFFLPQSGNLEGFRPDLSGYTSIYRPLGDVKATDSYIRAFWFCRSDCWWVLNSW